MSEIIGPVTAGSAPDSPQTAAAASVKIGSSRDDDVPLGPGFIVHDGAIEPLLERVTRLERRTRVQFYALVVLALGAVAFVFDGLLIEQVIVRQKLMESKELKLLDNDGNARLFLRMYSKVPVLQIMDGNGRPRMSLGLRFDDSPFVDLSDRSGRTRATLEITKDDAPALRMFDKNGNPTFNIN
jgi:hypothetical protein